MLMIIIVIVVLILLAGGIYYYLNSCNFAKECSYECFSKLLTNQLKEKNLLTALDSVDMNKVPPKEKDTIPQAKKFLNELINSTKGGIAENKFKSEFGFPTYNTDKTCNNFMNNYGSDIIKNIENMISLYK